jgi:hypothetical protein
MHGASDVTPFHRTPATVYYPSIFLLKVRVKLCLDVEPCLCHGSVERSGILFSYPELPIPLLPISRNHTTLVYHVTPPPPPPALLECTESFISVCRAGIVSTCGSAVGRGRSKLCSGSAFKILFGH